MKTATLVKEEWHVEWLDDEHGWIVDEAGNYIATIVTSDDEGHYVKSQRKREAMAILMSRAPKLLKALKKLRSDPSAWQLADEAIAEAEGLS